MTTCPHCNGHGESRGFINSSSRCRFGAIKCLTCDGSGQVDPELADRIQLAQEISRDRRNTRRETLRFEAKRLGVEFGEWTRILAGSVPETEAGRLAWGQRLREIGEMF